MKFKITVAVLVIAIIAFFASVVIFSNELSDKNELLEAKNDTLMMQKEALKRRNKEIEDYKDKLLNSVQSEDVYWEIAKNQNTPEAYLDYLVKFESDTTNQHAAEAKKSLDGLLNEKGFVQVVESNKNRLLDEITSYSQNVKFLKANQAMNVRRGVIGNSDYSPATRNGHILSEGQIVKVLKADIESGSTLWAQIAYSNQ